MGDQGDDAVAGEGAASGAVPFEGYREAWELMLRGPSLERKKGRTRQGEEKESEGIDCW